ncbi:unnamed protein product [Amoebophrya sp. A120]|nr:unnamed protein product [Amoebophrya sp. A120]|eukprot:GSA120T00016816001.1
MSSTGGKLDASSDGADLHLTTTKDVISSSGRTNDSSSARKGTNNTGTSKTSTPLSLHVSDWIELFGFGWGQVKILNNVGGIWLADGAELLLLSALIRAVSLEWDLNAAERGGIVSVVFIGVLLGNLLSGTLGDAIGRRVVTLAGFLFIVVFSVLSVFAWSFYSLAAFRLGVGVAFGIGQPSGVALMNELVPAHIRMAVPSLCTTYFVCGELFSISLICLNDPDMKELNWRALVLFGAIPSLIYGIWGLHVLRESALWLQGKNRTAEAVEVLEKIRSGNRAAAASSSILPPINFLRKIRRGEQGKALALKNGVSLDENVTEAGNEAANSVWRVPLVLKDPEEDKAMPSSRRDIMTAGASNAGPAAAGDNGYAVVAVEDTTTTRSAGNYHPQVEQTGDTGGPPAIEKSEDDWLQRFLLVISPKYFPTTFFLCFALFTCNVVFYGGLYVFPQVLADMGETLPVKPAISLMIATCFETIGACCAFFVGSNLLRKPALSVWLLCSMFCVTLFIAGVPKVLPGPETKAVPVLATRTSASSGTPSGGTGSSSSLWSASPHEPPIATSTGVTAAVSGTTTGGERLGPGAGAARQEEVEDTSSTSWVTALLGKSTKSKHKDEYLQKERVEQTAVPAATTSENTERAQHKEKLALKSTPLGPALLEDEEETPLSAGASPTAPSGTNDAERYVVVPNLIQNFLEVEEGENKDASTSSSQDAQQERQHSGASTSSSTEGSNTRNRGHRREVPESRGSNSYTGAAAQKLLQTQQKNSALAAHEVVQSAQEREAKRLELDEKLGHRTHVTDLLLQIGLCGQKVTVVMGFALITLFAIESYPTHCRATGVGAGIATGRLGAIAVPLIYEGLKESTGTHEAFFVFVLGLMFTSLMLLLFLPLRETSGASLDDVDQEVDSGKETRMAFDYLFRTSSSKDDAPLLPMPNTL